MTAPHRPAATQVRVAATRLPEHIRPRLARLATLGAEAFSAAHGPPGWEGTMRSRSPNIGTDA